MIVPGGGGGGGFGAGGGLGAGGGFTGPGGGWVAEGPGEPDGGGVVEPFFFVFFWMRSPGTSPARRNPAPVSVSDGTGAAPGIRGVGWGSSPPRARPAAKPAASTIAATAAKTKARIAPSIDVRPGA